MSQYHDDRAWSDLYIPQVKKILSTLIPHLISIRIASEEQDTREATDMVATFSTGKIAIRIRRPDCLFRDLTIRSQRANGMKTELAKIREGYGTHYFYAWTTPSNTIGEWILVDLYQLRKSPLLDKPAIPNTDKTTWFIPIKIAELREYDCLIAHQLKGSLSLNPLIIPQWQPQIDGLWLWTFGKSHHRLALVPAKNQHQPLSPHLKDNSYEVWLRRAPTYQAEKKLEAQPYLIAKNFAENLVAELVEEEKETLAFA
jgi:hypothetical protein